MLRIEVVDVVVSPERLPRCCDPGWAAVTLYDRHAAARDVQTPKHLTRE
jgi:hypothetical protein